MDVKSDPVNNQPVDKGFREEIADSVALVIDRQEEKLIEKLTREIAEKNAEVDRLDILSNHYLGKLNTWEGLDIEFTERTERLERDLRNIRIENQLLLKERKAIAEFEGHQVEEEMDKIRGHLLTQAISERDAAQVEWMAERFALQKSIANLTQFNAEQRAEVKAVRRSFDDLAGQLATRTVLFQALTRRNHEAAEIHKSTLTQQETEIIGLKARVEQLSEQLHLAQKQVTEFDFQLRETITSKSSLEQELSVVQEHKATIEEDLQDAIQKNRTLEVALDSYRSSSEGDLERYFTAEVENIRRECAGREDILRRELAESRQHLAIEASQKASLEEELKRVVEELEQKNAVLDEYGQDVRGHRITSTVHTEHTEHTEQRVIHSHYERELDDHNHQYVRNNRNTNRGDLEPDNQNQNQNQSVLRTQNRDYPGRHPDDNDSVVSNITDDPSGMHDGTDEVLRSSVNAPLSGVAGKSPAGASVGGAIAGGGGTGRRGRYAHVNSTGGEGVRESIDSMHSTGTGVASGTDDGSWLVNLLNGSDPAALRRSSDDELALRQQRGSRSGVGVAEMNDEPSVRASTEAVPFQGRTLTFTSQTMTVLRTFQLLADLSYDVPADMPSLANHLMNELVNAMVFPCDSPEHVQALYAPFQRVIEQMEEAFVRKLHQQPPPSFGEPLRSAAVHQLTPEARLSLPQHGTAVVHDISTVYSPLTPNHPPAAEQLKELEHWRQTAAELRRHLEAADEEIIRLRERLQKTPVACPLCAHRTQREAAIVSAERHRAVAAESELSGVRAELEACNEQLDYYRAEILQYEEQTHALTVQIKEYMNRCEVLDKAIAEANAGGISTLPVDALTASLSAVDSSAAVPATSDGFVAHIDPAEEKSQKAEVGVSPGSETVVFHDLVDQHGRSASGDTETELKLEVTSEIKSEVRNEAKHMEELQTLQTSYASLKEQYDKVVSDLDASAAHVSVLNASVSEYTHRINTLSSQLLSLETVVNASMPPEGYSQSFMAPPDGSSGPVETTAVRLEEEITRLNAELVKRSAYHVKAQTAMREAVMQAEDHMSKESLLLIEKTRALATLTTQMQRLKEMLDDQHQQHDNEVSELHSQLRSVQELLSEAQDRLNSSTSATSVVQCAERSQQIAVVQAELAAVQTEHLISVEIFEKEIASRDELLRRAEVTRTQYKQQMEEELLKISELLQEKERKLVETEALVLQEQREKTVLQESKDQLQARFENRAAQIEEFKSGGGADACDESAVMVDELRDQLTQKQHVCTRLEEEIGTLRSDLRNRVMQSELTENVLRTAAQKAEEQIAVEKAATLEKARILEFTEEQLHQQQQMSALLERKIQAQDAKRTELEGAISSLQQQLASTLERLYQAEESLDVPASAAHGGIIAVPSSTQTEHREGDLTESLDRSVESIAQMQMMLPKEFLDMTASLQIQMEAVKNISTLVVENIRDKASREDAEAAEGEMMKLRTSLDSKISLVNDQIARMREQDQQKQQQQQQLQHQSTVHTLQVEHAAIVERLQQRNSELQNINAELHRDNQVLLQNSVQLQQLLQSQAKQQHEQKQQHHQLHHDGHGEEKDSDSVVVDKGSYDAQVHQIVKQNNTIEKLRSEIQDYQEKFRAIREETHLLRDRYRLRLKRQAEQMAEEKRAIVDWVKEECQRVGEEFAALLKQNKEDVAQQYAADYQAFVDAQGGGHRSRSYHTNSAHAQSKHDFSAGTDRSRRADDSMDGGVYNAPPNTAKQTSAGVVRVRGPDNSSSGQRHRERMKSTSVEEDRHYQQQYEELVLRSSVSSLPASEERAPPRAFTTSPPRSQASARAQLLTHDKISSGGSVQIRNTTAASEQPHGVRFVPSFPLSQPPPPPPHIPPHQHQYAADMSEPTDAEILQLHLLPPKKIKDMLRNSETTLSSGRLGAQGEQKTVHSSSAQQPSYANPTLAFTSRQRTAYDEAAMPQIEIHPPASIGDIAAGRVQSRPRHRSAQPQSQLNAKVGSAGGSSRLISRRGASQSRSPTRAAAREESPVLKHTRSTSAVGAGRGAANEEQEDNSDDDNGVTGVAGATATGLGSAGKGIALQGSSGSKNQNRSRSRNRNRNNRNNKKDELTRSLQEEDYEEFLAEHQQQGRQEYPRFTQHVPPSERSRR